MTSIRHLSGIEQLRRIDNPRSLFQVNPPNRLCSTQATFTLKTAARKTKAIKTTLAATQVMLVLVHKVLQKSIYLTLWVILAPRHSSPNNLRCKLILCKWWCSSRQLIKWWWDSSLWTQWWLRCSKLWLSACRCSNRWCNNHSLSSNPSNLL